MDLIDRQAALDALRDRYYKYDRFAKIEELVWAIEALPSAQPTEASCWGCNCPKMERSKEQKTFSEMVHLHDVETSVLPSAQPACKNGKWIQFPTHMAYKCSECGRVIQTTDGRRNVSKHYPFCRCGADMRGDHHDD